MQLKRRRMIMAAGIALAILLAVIFLYDVFGRRTQEFNEALYVKQVKLAKYRQKVLEKKAVDKELLNLQRAFKQAQAALLTGKTPSLAAAEIQEIVSRITKTAGGQIMTVRILQPDRSGKDLYLAIPVEVTVSSTMRQLTQLLYQLDRSAKLLRITKLAIRSSPGRVIRRRGKQGGGPVNITTTLTVEGFLKKMEI